MKSLVGATKHPEDRYRLHMRNVEEKIAELNLAFRPDLNIIDGWKCFVKGGPDKGEVKEPHLILAGKDRVALDAAGVAVLKTLGTEERLQKKSPWEQAQICRAAQLGLGAKSAKEVELRSAGVQEIKEIGKNLL
jgi:uncharacterized protein (DUF362 family)